MQRVNDRARSQSEVSTPDGRNLSYSMDLRPWSKSLVFFIIPEFLEEYCITSSPLLAVAKCTETFQLVWKAIGNLLAAQVSSTEKTYQGALDSQRSETQITYHKNTSSWFWKIYKMHCIGEYLLIVKEGKTSVSTVDPGCTCLLVRLHFAISIFYSFGQPLTLGISTVPKMEKQ